MTRDTTPDSDWVSASDRRTYVRMVALLALLVAAWAAVWAVVTPVFRSPDEQNHVNSVLRIAYGGGWPAPGDARFAPVIEQAVEEAAYPADLPGRYYHRPDQRQFVDVTPVPREERARVDATNALPPPGSDATVDQMTQHPPAYYALGAAFLHATGLTDARWDQVMLALRMMDAALFAATIPFLAATVLRLTGSRSAALVAAPLVLLVPEVGHMMGSANNDTLVVLVCAVVTYLCARVVTGDVRWRVAVAIGVLLGVGMLTKVMVAFAVPTVLAAYLLAPGVRWRTRLDRAAVSMLLALAVGGWWWVRNVVTLGAVQPVGLPRDLSTLSPVPDDEALHLSIGRIAQSFFGHLSWLEVRLDGTLVVLGSVVLGVASVIALLLPGARRAAAALLLLPAALAGGVLYNALDFHAETHRLVALHGRYVYGGLVALLTVLAVAVWQLLRLLRRSERWTAVAVPVVCALAVAGGAAGLWWGFGAMYRGPGDSLAAAVDRWAAWSPVPWAQLLVVVGAGAAVAVAALVATVRWATITGRRESRLDRRTEDLAS